jgi:DNA-binding transcriptional LysR family regulator
MLAIDSIDVVRASFGVRTMKLSGVDANLLAALDALLCEKSVTRAAKRLGIGQPALSHSLARLRIHFNDELLVLRGRNYQLTDKAEKLCGVVQNATRAMSMVFDEPPGFDAATASSRFVVACSDLLAVLVIPELLRTVQNDAAHVQIEVRAVAPGPSVSALDGGVDLALGIFEDVPRSTNQQFLYDDVSICVIRANHERVGKKLTLKTYCALPHLEIAGAHDAATTLHIDRALSTLGKERHVTLNIPYYLLAPRILERSDCVATVSSSGAQVLAQMAPLRRLPAPIELPPHQFSQIWRNALNDDRGHTWLREHIARICRRLGPKRHDVRLS